MKGKSRRSEARPAPRPSRGTSPVRSVVNEVVAMQTTVQPTSSSAGECNFVDARGVNEVKELLPMLKNLVGQMEAQTKKAQEPGASIFKESFFCGLGNLRSHLEAREDLEQQIY